MYKTIKKCRACGCGELYEAYDLGIQPLANNFMPAGGECSGHAPLKVMFCANCTNSQLSVVVDPNIIYRNYPYVTSKSDTMKEHFEELWSEIIKEENPRSVLEIGSNDGFFLQFCKSKGIDLLTGIDPALNLRPANGSGIFAITSLFDESIANTVAKQRPLQDVIVARHVFCHIDDWKGFIKNLVTISHQESLIVIEVPYVMDMLNGVEFDTIYHEHLGYLSVKSIHALLYGTGLHLHKIIRFSIHGGAIVMMLRRDGNRACIDSSVEQFTSRENVTLDSWREFAFKSNVKINKLRDLVIDLTHTRNKIVCGFGASAKSTVWINACGFDRREIDFICDCTPSKQDKLSPGSDIPVRPESYLLNQLPEYAILFAWNFKDEIIRKNSKYLEKGGKFIVPDESISIIEHC